ncbi:MAG: hypothetical protein IAG13_37615, partial [Deltaproteobacteria bacterium]|nr:hypothetical protein [Nannocystaceae bacterium]
MRASILALVTACSTACLQAQVYPCEDDIECVVDGLHGVCHSSGYCAYPDGRCTSQQRFGPAAGGGRAHDCVPTDSIGGESQGETQSFIDGSETASGSSLASGEQSTATDGCGGCVDPPNDCFAPTGSCGADGCVYEPRAANTACVIDDPCVTAAECDGAGTCVVIEGMQCNEPPGPCFAAQGECEPDGTCSYTPLPVDTECNDGNECTFGERCDAASVCGGGDECPQEDPCMSSACVAGSCEDTPVADGTLCGLAEADRCCAGSCVDISSDGDNCGGCGLQCEANDICESVSVTSTCDPAP